MGMKEIDNTTDIVDKKEAEFLDKTTNVTLLSELTENKYLIRYSGQINDNIRKLYIKDSISLDKIKVYNKSELRKSGFNKIRDIPSAVHIEAAIAS